MFAVLLSSLFTAAVDPVAVANRRVALHPTLLN